MMYLVVFSSHLEYSSENKKKLYQAISRVKKMLVISRKFKKKIKYLLYVWSIGLVAPSTKIAHKFHYKIIFCSS